MCYHTGSAPLVVVEYVREDGSIPYESWFNDLSAQAAAKVAIARMDGSDIVILLGGGTKRHQQTDIGRAKALLAEYRGRKRASARTKRKR